MVLKLQGILFNVIIRKDQKYLVNSKEKKGFIYVFWKYNLLIDNLNQSVQ
jgi:hypothetical protein